MIAPKPLRPPALLFPSASGCAAAAGSVCQTRAAMSSGSGSDPTEFLGLVGAAEMKSAGRDWAAAGELWDTSRLAEPSQRQPLGPFSRGALRICPPPVLTVSTNRFNSSAYRVGSACAQAPCRAWSPIGWPAAMPAWATTKGRSAVWPQPCAMVFVTSNGDDAVQV